MKPLSAKAQVTRDKILRAANDLFYEHGYNATGLDRIIAEAGVAKGNFYHHFKSKEALAGAVLDWHRDKAFEEIDLQGLLREPSPLNAVVEMVTRMSSRMVSHRGECHIRGCFFGNLALELSTGSETLRRKIQHVFDGIREQLRELIIKAQEAGEIRQSLDPKKTAGLLLGLIEGAVLLDKTAQTEQETRDAIEFVRSYLTG